VYTSGNYKPVKLFFMSVMRVMQGLKLPTKAFDIGHKLKFSGSYYLHLSLIACLLALSLATLQTHAGALAPLSLPPLSLQSNIRFKPLEHEQIESLGEIRAIAQDQQGFMWFGSANGLARYDGRDIKLYQSEANNPTRISSNTVNDLLVDSKGYLWAGSYWGLNRYDPKHDVFRYYVHEFAVPNSLDRPSHNSVITLLEDKHGMIWFGTDGGGLNRFNPETHKFKHITHDPQDSNSIASNTIREVYYDSQDHIWIGYRDGGVDRLSHTPDGNIHQVKHFTPSNSGLSSSRINAILEDSKGHIWVATRNGLNRLDKQTQQFTTYKTDPEDKHALASNFIRQLIIDQYDRLWVIGSDGWQYVYREESDDFIRYFNDIAMSARVAFNNQQGEFWIGYSPKGLTRLDRYASAFQNYHHTPGKDNSLSHSDIFSVVEDHDANLWVGTRKGLNHIDRKTGEIRRYTKDPSNPNAPKIQFISALLMENPSTLWLGSNWDGLKRLDLNTGHFTHYMPEEGNPNSLINREIWSILKDSQENIWVGTNRATLNRYDRKKDHFQRFQVLPDKLGSGRILAQFEDSRGDLWFAGDDGLFRKELNTTVFEHFPEYSNKTIRPSLPSLRAIHEDSKGNMWFATGGKGINKWNVADDTYHVYKNPEGHSHNVIMGILEDDKGMLWLSSANGISRFDPVKKEFRNYTSQHGLAGNQHHLPVSLKTSSGELAFGSSEGLTIFNPDHIYENTQAPKVVITEMRLFNRVVTPNPLSMSSFLKQAITHTKALTFNHKQSVFSFQFSVLNYDIPEMNQYAYMLEGFDSGWVYSGSRNTATYTNLDPGYYVFKVKGSNNEGVWNEEGSAIAITVLPPWWRSWWAFSIYILIFALISWLIFYTLWNKKQAQEAQAQRLARTQFFASMSHEIRTPLTAIKGYAELIESQSPPGSEFKDHSNTIILSSNHLIQIVNDILDLSKVEAGRIETESIEVNLPLLISEIKTVFSILAHKKGITFSAEILGDIPSTIHSDPTRIKQILINICGNAVKFTPKGHVRLTVSCLKDQAQMIFCIEDSGIGMSLEQSNKLFNAFIQADVSTNRNYGGTGLGLYVSKQLAENMGGDIQVESQIGRGSKFTITINTGSLDNRQWLSRLPDERDSRTRTKAPQEPTYIKPKNLSQLQGRVLYAEDNHNNQTLVRGMLNVTGVNLTIVDNGLEAVKAIVKGHHSPSKKEAFDLVLLDLRMPVMGGVGAARELLKKGIRVPLIAITANIEEAGIHEYIELGFVAFIEKPFYKEKFYSTIAPHLTQVKILAPPSKGHVLLAEDNKINQVLIRRFLNDCDIDLVVVDDGQQALDHIQHHPVDVVLMDMNMPIMDGKEATLKLREQGFDKPIYALTAEADPAQIKTYLDAGCNACLSKPIDITKLKQFIETGLTKKIPA